MVDESEGPPSRSDASSEAKEPTDDTLKKVAQRELIEKSPTQTEKSLTQEEREVVADNGKLSALTVYSIILREGEEELRRPKTSLWWSGVAAGIGISTSVLAEGIIRTAVVADAPYLSAIESLGYTLGFVLVTVLVLASDRSLILTKQNDSPCKEKSVSSTNDAKGLRLGNRLSS